jgi:hypothetical protein
MVPETGQHHNTTNNTSTLTKQRRDDRLQQTKEQELWTTECLVDQLFLCLAGTNEYITTNTNDETIPVKKYYSQARQLMKWIPIARPAPEFVINISDLKSKVRKEIESIIDSPSTLQYVLTQAVGRIFENIDFDYYHLSIARNLKVKFEH